MTRHSTLSGTALHDPKGKSPTPLTLADNLADAYIIQDIGSTRIFGIDTVTATPQIRLALAASFTPLASPPTAQASRAKLYSRTVSGTTGLYAQDSAGVETQLTPISVSGTSQLSFAINSDATSGANEDPYLSLVGGDGGEVVVTHLRQDSSADTVYLFHQATAVADDTADRSTTFVLGPMTAFSSTGLDADSTLTLRGHLSGNGTSVFKDASVSIDASASQMVFTTPSSGTYKFNTGDITFTGSLTVTKISPTFTIGQANQTLTFVGSQVTSNAADFIFNCGATNAHNGNSFLIEVQNNGTSYFKINYAGGIDIIQKAPQSGFTAQPMIRATGAAATLQLASTEIIDFDLNAQRTLSFSAGALSTQRCFRLLAPTYAFASASTITNAATFYIDGAPTAGTNATITNQYSVWIAGGKQLHEISAAGSAYIIKQVSSSNQFLTISASGGGAITWGFVGCGHTFNGTNITYSADSAGYVDILRNDSSAAAALIVENTSTGDAAIKIDLSGGGGETWTIGADNSDSDSFKISESATLGTTDRLRIIHDAGAMGFRSHTTGAADEDDFVETVRVVTTNNTPTLLWSRVVPATDAIVVEALVVAQSDTSGAHESAWYKVIGGARRYAAGNVTQIGLSTAVGSGEEDVLWDCAIDVDVGSQSIRIMVTGNTTDNTVFEATVRYRRHAVA